MLPGQIEQASAERRFGHYVLDGKLGVGGCGEVWKAWDTQLGRWVAVKLLRGSDDTEVARFIREAQTAARLSHANIAAIYEAGVLDGRHFIVMQYVDGRTLKGVPRDDRRVVVEIMRDAARAIDYAHGSGVIHRDVKPDNVMVERSRVYVLDFGLAKAVRDAGASATGALMVGTPNYMSPEQARGDPVDARTDVYSLGATLYEMLTGRPPFVAPTVVEVFEKILNEEPRALEGELGVIAAKAMDKDRDRRYPTAAAFADDLDRWLKGEPISARPASAFYRLRKFVGRRKPVVVTAAIGLAALVAALVTVVPGWRRAAEAMRERERRLEAAARARPHVDRAREHLRDVERLLAQDRPDDSAVEVAASRARGELARALKEDGRCAEAHLVAARAWRLLDDDDRALEACDRAIATDPQLMTAYLDRARILIDHYERERHLERGPEAPGQKELWRRIEDDLRRVETWSGGTDEALLVRAARAFVEERWGEAAAQFEQFAAAHPGDESAWRDAGHAWLHEKRSDAAEASLTRAVELMRSRARTRYLRGLARLEAGRVEDAVADLRLAVERAPREPGHHSKLGEALLRAGRETDAAAAFDKAVELEPEEAAWRYNRGVFRLGARRADEAEADFTRAIELRRDHARAYVNRGTARMAMGRCDEAEADCTRAVELSPRDALAFGNRAEVRAALKRFAEAEADADRAIELSPREWRLFGMRGDLRARRGAWRDALADWRQALALEPAAEPRLKPLIDKARRAIGE